MFVYSIADLIGSIVLFFALIGLCLFCYWVVAHIRGAKKRLSTRLNRTPPAPPRQQK